MLKNFYHMRISAGRNYNEITCDKSCDKFQIFIKNSQNWHVRPLSVTSMLLYYKLFINNLDMKLKCVAVAICGTRDEKRLA